jgi:SAM-dependent methyltransferase
MSHDAIDFIHRTLGRLSLVFEGIRPILATARGESAMRGPAAPFDKTGLLVKRAQQLPVLWSDEEVHFVKYDSLAHSFWRAQELSLFRNHLRLLEEPILDFGCGDGSFASCLLRHIALGVDNDREALAIAEQYGIYGSLIASSTAAIPLPTASVGSIMSNSVLEHLLNLESMLAEFARVLGPGGCLLFTAPVAEYKEHLAKYFGRAESERVNAEAAHHNLLTPAEWQALVERHGFVIKVLHPYQPDWFTYWYRMLRLVGPRGLGFFLPGASEIVWRRWQTNLIGMVRDSIKGAPSGANILMACTKR